jgi:hypothetical protein
MVKAAYEDLSTVIPRKILANAARGFLLNHELNEALVPARNIDSQRFGSSDLVLVSEAENKLVVGMLNDGRACKEFLTSSIAYRFWLDNSLRASKVSSDRQKRVEMYLFSSECSSARLYLMDEVFEPFMIHMIEYRILQVQGSDDRIIFFRHMTSRDDRSEKLHQNKIPHKDHLFVVGNARSGPVNLSTQELKEFNRLSAHYLDP